MKRQICLTIAVALPVVWFTACRSSQSTAPAKQRVVRTQHWIQNDALQAIMKKLDATTAGHWPSTLPDDPEAPSTVTERNQAFKDGAMLAFALEEAAQQIPNSIEEVNLSDADRTAFISTAQVLSDQARELGRAARRRSIEAMHEHLDATRATCISCHTRFKDISGALPPRA